MDVARKLVKVSKWVRTPRNTPFISRLLIIYLFLPTEHPAVFSVPNPSIRFT